jgi:hypothetical protein
MIDCKRMFPPMMGLAAMFLVGCSGGMSAEELKDMRPQRPAELDKLNSLVGTWESTWTMKPAGKAEPMTGKGTSTIAWDVDKWCLVEKGNYEMADMGPMQGLGVWTWDAKAHTYRNWWFDNWGTAGAGTSKYDENTKTWNMRGTSRGAMGRTSYKGTMKLVDDKTMQWTWKEYVFLGLIKVFEGEGTGKKK